MVPPAGAGPTDRMTRTVLALCDEAPALLASGARAELAALRASVTEPLRVAVVGRVSAGKSTLVNALIGRRVAPTAAGECTRVVTWYRFGAPDRAQLVLRDGTVHPLPFDGALPETPAVPAERIERIEVFLQAGALRQMTLIDTPGLGSLDRPGDEAVRRVAIGEGAAGETPSSRAVEQASALLYLFRDVEKQDDIDFIRAHQAATGPMGSTAAGVIGVLSHADLFGSGPWSPRDPLVEARTVADRIAGDHPTLLTAVAPVAALLGQAARTGLVTETKARTLAALQPVETARLQMLPRFGVPPGVDAAAVGDVLHELGPYAVNYARGVAGAGAGALQNWLSHRSGLSPVEELVGTRFVRRCVPLTVERVLRGLRGLSRSMPASYEAGVRLRDRIEQVELQPAMHRIAELRALQLLAGRSGALARDLTRELDLMIDNDDPWRRLGAGRPLSSPELRAELTRRWDRAQTATTTARDPRVGEAARVLTRSYALVGADL
jgi:hypothetical protein